MRLASWNIRKCVGLDRRRDPLRVASVIAGLDADIVALQEADKRLGRRPAALPFETVRNETDMQVVDAGGLEGSLGWHGNAVLVRPEINVTGRVAMDLPGVEPRGALILDLEAKGQSLRLVAVHLGLLRSSRRAQLAALQARLAKMKARPTVILGDFNEWSRSRGIEALLGYDIHAPGRSFMRRARWQLWIGSRLARNGGWKMRAW